MKVTLLQMEAKYWFFTERIIDLPKLPAFRIIQPGFFMG